MGVRMARPVARTKVPPAAPSQADASRERILTRCPDLERVSPDAVDLAAEAVAALHEALNGHAIEYAGNRPASYFRRQVRGEEALTAEDLARLAIQAPAALVAWLCPLLRAVAHGAPQEMTAALAQVIPLVDERLQAARAQLAGLEATAKRVQGWKKS
jgi:hypothetical protein